MGMKGQHALLLVCFIYLFRYTAFQTQVESETTSRRQEVRKNQPCEQPATKLLQDGPLFIFLSRLGASASSFPKSESHSVEMVRKWRRMYMMVKKTVKSPWRTRGLTSTSLFHGYCKALVQACSMTTMSFHSISSSKARVLVTVRAIRLRPLAHSQ